MERSARINVIKDMLFRLEYKDKDDALLLPETDIVFNFAGSYLHNA